MKYLIALCMILHVSMAAACGEIRPSASVTRLVTQLAYRDFPTSADIFAHIRVESSFNPHAINRSSRQSSVGLMQVQDGSMDERANITSGVALLRKYYKITHSKEGASKAYNIGITAYMHGRHKQSAERYYRKIKLWRKVYEHYPEVLGNYNCYRHAVSARRIRSRLF